MEFNPLSIGCKFLDLLREDYPFIKEKLATDPKCLVAIKLKEYLHEILTETQCEVDAVIEELDSANSSSQCSVYDDRGDEIQPDNSQHCSIERKERILRLIQQHPGWSIKSIQRNGGREFKFASYKKIWEEQVKKGGTVFEKYERIDRYTYDRFTEARDELKPVKESNLRLWALQATQLFRDSQFSFKASHGWIASFKRKHGISSRKITKLVSKREFLDTDTILESAKSFQVEVKALSENFSPFLILNTDQAGFAYELTGNRTLSHKGEKVTLGIAKSPHNLVTHSYTVQYVITLAGTIVGDVFVCLQEPTGKLGPLVQNALFPASNVTVTCSTSGKLTTSLYEYFLDEVLVKNMHEDFILLLDSWSGQTNVSSYENRFGINGKPACKLKIIPKKCTSLVQPLDTTFHRQLKYFAKLIYSEAMNQDQNNTNPVDEITTRNNIIRTQSLLHNQLSAPIFMPLIKYSWFSSGLTDDKPYFDSVKEACFTFENREIVCSICAKPRFVKCAHCRTVLCFSCFYYDYHFHFQG